MSRTVITITISGLVLFSGTFPFLPLLYADADNSIVINEIMYYPSSKEAGSEWVELYNAGNSLVDMTSWTVNDSYGERFMFPGLMVPQGTYVLLHNGSGVDDTDFADNAAHLYLGTKYIWNNDGDCVLLRNSEGTPVDFVAYDEESAPCPPPLSWGGENPEAGKGLSICLFPNGRDTDSGDSWVEAAPTPGESNGDSLGTEEKSILITEVYYNAYRNDEYLKIFNPTDRDIGISKWSLGDGEGSVSFPDGTVLPANKEFYITKNATSFIEDTGIIPDFEYGGSEAGVQDMDSMGSVPALRNDGDEIKLCYFTEIIDAVVFGDSNYDGAGWVGTPVPAVEQGKLIKRKQPFADTNSSLDWQSYRRYGIGQSDFPYTTFDFNGSVEVFCSPDSSYDVISERIEGTEKSMYVNVYEFRNFHLAGRLISAVERGVEVKVLLEGGPVGGLSDESRYIAGLLHDAGAEVYFMINDDTRDIYDRYAFSHAKYAVIDGRYTIVMSENWGDTGVPVNSTYGNRGWGVCVENEELAYYFTNLFQTDCNPDIKDIVRFPYGEKYTYPEEYEMNTTVPEGNYNPVFGRKAVNGTFKVSPVLAPDTSLLPSDSILGTIRGAEKAVYVSQFYIYKHWGSRAEGSPEETPNLYLEEVINAARRGCEIRIILDSSWYNVEEGDYIDNDDTKAYLEEIAEEENLDIGVRFLNTSHGLVKNHNKGLIVDGKKALVSSINWNRNSPMENREAGLIVENERVAGYFTDIFDMDWKDDIRKPEAFAGEDRIVDVGRPVYFDAGGSADNVGIASYSWDFDSDGVTDSNDATGEFVYHEEGIYNATLNVTDTEGNYNKDSCTVTVLALGPEGDHNNNPPPPLEDGDNGTVIQENAGKGISLPLYAVIFILPVAVASILYIKRWRGKAVQER